MRRLLALALSIAILAPVPASAARPCAMRASMAANGEAAAVPSISGDRAASAMDCDCCKRGNAASGGSRCKPSLASASGCDCAIEAATHDATGPAPAAFAASVAFTFTSVLLPASLTTPQPTLRIVAHAASPPGAGRAVERPLLCSWTI